MGEAARERNGERNGWRAPERLEQHAKVAAASGGRVGQ